MTVPTFVTGLLPSYAQIGIFAPMILVVMRILQSFPAGGELPGASCYLYESSQFSSRRLMCCWSSLGFQLGILISTLECFFLEKFLSFEDLNSWGWRMSFLIGGLLGLGGLFLRSKLHETPLYKEMTTHERVLKEPLKDVFKKYKTKLIMSTLFCFLNSSGFYLLTINFPFYLGSRLGTSYGNTLIYTSILLICITIPLPFFGMLGDKFSNKKMLIGSTLGIMAILIPLCYSTSITLLIILILLFCLFITCLSALLPFAQADLFPTHARYTCLGISFNIADAVIGGFTPVVVLLLLNLRGNQGDFCWFLLACAIISLSSYFMMKEKHPPH